MPTSQNTPDVPQSYAGPERRGAPRIPANYPIRILRILSTGERFERYAQTKNISSEGILLSSVDTLRPGTRVNVSVGIPFVYAASLPSVQLDCAAVVVRSEPIDSREADEFGTSIALKFLQKPTVSTELSMFD
jgi:hypothetical protein